MNRVILTYDLNTLTATPISAVSRSASTGKERDEETGYGYFGARYMDHELMTMWLSVDPMADKYPGISPYAYCAWNPVKLVDPKGRDVEIVKNDVNKTVTVKANFYYNSKEMGEQVSFFMKKFNEALDSWSNDIQEALRDELLGASGYTVSFEYSCIDSNHPEDDAKSDKSGIGNWISHVEDSGSKICVVNNKNLQLDFNFKRVSNEGEIDEWFFNIDHGTIKHEIGHFFGLRDRYDGATDPAPYIQDDLMTTDINRGNAVEPFKRVWRTAGFDSGTTRALINCNSNREKK